MGLPVLSGMRRPGPGEWKQLVAEFEMSGVLLGAFQYRLYKKSQRTSARPSEVNSSPRATFLPLEVVASPGPLSRKGFLLELVARPARCGAS